MATNRIEEPTREELDRLAQRVNDWPLVTVSLGDRERIRALLRAYPVPAAEGERGGVTAWLREQALLCEDVPEYAANLRAAAALLLQPVGGVNREAVVDVLRKGHRTLGDVLAAVRALPDASAPSVQG